MKKVDDDNLEVRKKALRKRGVKMCGKKEPTEEDVRMIEEFADLLKQKGS